MIRRMGLKSFTKLLFDKLHEFAFDSGSGVEFSLCAFEFVVFEFAPSLFSSLAFDGFFLGLLLLVVLVARFPTPPRCRIPFDFVFFGFLEPSMFGILCGWSVGSIGWLGRLVG